MRVAAVTGVSRGLGKALVDELLDDPGTRVLAIGRRFTGAQRVTAARSPDRLRLINADLAEAAALPGRRRFSLRSRGMPWSGNLRNRFAAELAGCSKAVLLHNAAVVRPVGPVGALPDGELAAAIAVNLTAPALLTNAFLAAVPDSARRVSVVFVSSGAAGRAVEGFAAYCATKRGAEAFVEVVAAEAARRDPRVRAISVNPGVIDTEMQADLRAAEFPDRDRYLRLHERGELASPAEVARKIITEHLTDE